MLIEEVPGIASVADCTKLDPVGLALFAADHVGGIRMATLATDNADDGAVAELAASIARNQRSEVNEHAYPNQRLDIVPAYSSLSKGELAPIASATTGS